MGPVAELLGIRYPVIMGAMGMISNAELVAAVSEGGGLGVLASVGMDADGLRETIAEVRKLTGKPFGVNLMVRYPLSPALAEVLVEEGVTVASTSAGDPAALAPRLKQAGIKVFHVVPSPAYAVNAMRAGVDFVVAEGGESGGIQSPQAVSTLTLVPHAVREVDIPVVAAGGIHDGRGYAAARAMGAAGVQIGTRLMLTEECGIHPDVKQVLLRAQPGETTVLPIKMGMVRVLANELARGLEEAPREERVEKCTGAWAQSFKAFRSGDMSAGLVIAGECAGDIEDIMPAGEVVRRMAEDGEAILRGL